MKRAKLIWRDLGPIKANTALDNVPKQSGVYKLTFHLWGNAYAYMVKLALAACGDVLGTSEPSSCGGQQGGASSA